MNAILDITVIDYDDIIEAIFNQKLPRLEKTNPFSYKSSSGYYDKNKVNLEIGLVFYTPTKRESKIYPYASIHLMEDVISGECEWVSDIETPKKLKKKADYFLDDRTINSHFIPSKLKNGIAYAVVSTGSGGLPLYRLDL